MAKQSGNRDPYGAIYVTILPQPSSKQKGNQAPDGSYYTTKAS